MKRQMTFQQYRATDLFFFSVMLLISEYVIVTAARHWFPDQLYTVSAAGPIVCIVLMRWGPWAAVQAILAGAVTCFFSGAEAPQYLIYCGGNLLALLAALFRKKAGPERIRQSTWLSLVFAAAVVLLMQAGRALAALLLGHEAAQAAGFFTTDALSAVFTLVIIWIARRLDGIFEDQKHYLLRLHQAEKEEKGGYT